MISIFNGMMRTLGGGSISEIVRVAVKRYMEEEQEK